jgi:hypothetical protein
MVVTSNVTCATRSPSPRCEPHYGALYRGKGEEPVAARSGNSDLALMHRVTHRNSGEQLSVGRVT